MKKEIQKAKILYDKMLKENSTCSSTEMMVEFAKQARQDQTRKVLNEVIEWVNINPDGTNACTILFKLQSMLPKEEFDWSKASIEERKIECTKRYQIGVEFYPLSSDGSSYSQPVKFDGNINSNGEDICMVGKTGFIYEYINNKWAEIVSEPVIQDEEIKVGDELICRNGIFMVYDEG